MTTSHLADRHISKSAPPRGMADSDRLDLWSGLLLAALDCSVILAYVLDVRPETWHTSVLALKILAAICLYKYGGYEARVAPFAAGLFIAVMLSAAFGTVKYASLLQFGGFLAHLLLTARLIRPSNLRHYVIWTGYFITLSGAAYIVMCYVGMIELVWGRYFYFGREHPNLGGEICAIGALCAALSLTRTRFYICTVVLLGVCIFLQSRASMLVIVALMGVRYFSDTSYQVGLSPRKVALAAFTLIVVSASMFLAGDLILSSISDALLLDNKYRGLGTGATGRSVHWASALDVFKQHPAFGAGYRYFQSEHILQPHNFALYALAETGILGFSVVVISTFKYYIDIIKKNLQVFMIFACMLPMLMMNDRFLNLNPYPFTFFMLLIVIGHHGAVDTSQIVKRVRTVRNPMPWEVRQQFQSSRS